MGLERINFLPIYKKKDDVLNNFYIPTLSEASCYKRVSAYFSADVLKLYSKGLSSFKRNNGKIQFIFSKEISYEDYEAIKKGYDGRFNNEIAMVLNNLNDSIEISNLSYLISIGVVDIKFGFVKQGILHFKYGLIKDEFGNIVCFRGSTNETPAGLLLNGENFEVSCSWNADSQEKIKIDEFEKDFDDLWSNRYDGVFTIDAPSCFASKIKEFSKDNLILDYEDDCKNSFVLDFDQNYRVIGYSFLNNKEILSKRTFFYKTKLNSVISNVRNLDVFYFKDLYVSELKKLINDLKNNSNENNYKLIVTNRVKEFIDKQEKHLKQRITLGEAIKEHDNSVLQKFDDFKNIVDGELERKLKEPQYWDAFHAANMISACNFSVPGTGKTTIAYAAFAYLSSKNGGNKVNKIIMIGPKNSFMAWKNEFESCFGKKRNLKCINIQDPGLQNQNKRMAALSQEFSLSNLILVNYDALLNFSLLNCLKGLMQRDNFNSYLILDEAHKIKALDGKRANAVLKLSDYAKYKLILTGTPIPNSYLDIYNMLNIMFNKDDYKNFFNFSKIFLEESSFIQSQQESINKKIYPFFCRTTKKDLKMPNVTFNDTEGYVLMDEKEKILFKILYQYYSSNILLLYIRLLQASVNPSLILDSINRDDFYNVFGDSDINEIDDEDLGGNKGSKFYDDKQISKDKIYIANEDRDFIKSCGLTNKFYKGIEIVSKLVSNGKSVVVWGIFVKTLDLIQNELTKQGITSIVISGSISLEEREKNIQLFLNKKFSVLISNPHTLAESVSLHTICHDAVYFEYSFNLTHFLQSRDRIHRLGIPNDTITTYYFLILDGVNYRYNSIDLKTLKRLKDKEERMLNAIETKQLFIKTESYKEDINFIFNIDSNSK